MIQGNDRVHPRLTKYWYGVDVVGIDMYIAMDDAERRCSCRRGILEPLLGRGGGNKDDVERRDNGSVEYNMHSDLIWRPRDVNSYCIAAPELGTSALGMRDIARVWVGIC